jgi:hypothetical protein
MAERFFDQSVLALDILDQALHSGYAGYILNVSKPSMDFQGRLL